MKILVADNIYIANDKSIIKRLIFKYYLTSIIKKIDKHKPYVVFVSNNIKKIIIKKYSNLNIVGYDDNVIFLRENFDYNYIHNFKKKIFINNFKSKKLNSIVNFLKILDIRFTDKIFHEIFIYFDLINEYINKNNKNEIITVGSSLIEKYSLQITNTKRHNFSLSNFFCSIISYVNLFLILRMSSISKNEKNYFNIPLKNKDFTIYNDFDFTKKNILFIGTIDRSLFFLKKLFTKHMNDNLLFGKTYLLTTNRTTIDKDLANQGIKVKKISQIGFRFKYFFFERIKSMFFNVYYSLIYLLNINKFNFYKFNNYNLNVFFKFYLFLVILNGSSLARRFENLSSQIIKHDFKLVFFFNYDEFFSSINILRKTNSFKTAYYKFIPIEAKSNWHIYDCDKLFLPGDHLYKKFINSKLYERKNVTVIGSDNDNFSLKNNDIKRIFLIIRSNYGNPINKENIIKYFQDINNSLKNLINDKNYNFKVYLKDHPLSDKKILQKFIDILEFDVHVINNQKNLDSIISNADLCISSITSGIFNSIKVKTPIICHFPEHLLNQYSFVGYPFRTRYSILCTSTPNDLKQNINLLLFDSNFRKNYIKILDELSKNFYSDFNFKNLKKEIKYLF